MTAIKSLTVVIPALNEEEAMPAVLAAMPHEELKKMGVELDVLVVDNGSTDRTAEVARQGGATVISEPRRGYGRAYKTGFDAAKGEVLAALDADCTYPPADLPRMIALMREKDLDLVLADRLHGKVLESMHFVNWIGNKALSGLARLFYDFPVNDTMTGMWLVKKSMWSQLDLASNQFAFTQEFKIEAICIAKARFAEVRIEYAERVGTSKLNPMKDGLDTLRILFMKKLGLGRTKKG